MNTNNPRSLTAALELVGGFRGIPTLAQEVTTLAQVLDLAERFGYESAQMDGNEMYDDGYLDAIHDFDDCPAIAFDRADAIEDERETQQAWADLEIESWDEA